MGGMTQSLFCLRRKLELCLGKLSTAGVVSCRSSGWFWCLLSTEQPRGTCCSQPQRAALTMGISLHLQVVAVVVVVPLPAYGHLG